MTMVECFRISIGRFGSKRLFICLIINILIYIGNNAYYVTASNEISGKVYENLFKTISTTGDKDLIGANARLRKLLSASRLEEAHLIVDSIPFLISNATKADSVNIADGYYLIGTYYLRRDNSILALKNLKEAVNLFEKTGNKLNPTYSFALNNTAVAFYNSGDFTQALSYFEASLKNDKLLYGDSSSNLISGYSGLSIVNIYIRNYAKAIEWIDMGLNIAHLHSGTVEPTIIASLYSTKGVIYTYLADYERAKNNLEKAESYYRNKVSKDNNYVNMMDNLGTAYHFLGSKEKSYYYYEKGLRLISNDFSQTAFNLTNNYAIILGNDSLPGKGEVLLSDFLKRVQLSPDKDKRFYYMVLRTYADYLREYKINSGLAKQIYLECFSYLNAHPWDNDYRDNIILGYSQSLFQNGENGIALDSINTLLFADKKTRTARNSSVNPSSLKTDGRSIKILRTKYQFLWSEYKKANDIAVLEAAAQTAELIVEVIEKIRLNIGEEGSRLILGDKYRNSFMDAIKCLNECYLRTNNKLYLEKAFEYSEKSKVASLLASTREIKAIQKNIPSALADKEKELQWNIGFYNSILAEEENKEKPDSGKISLWKDYILVSTQRKDSLLNVFEKNYPDYYSLKYDSRVVGLKKIPEIIGRRKNYLSYIVSDSLIYTFVSNRKNHQLIIQKIDPSFLEMVTAFRRILSSPDLDEKSAEEFTTFQNYGYKLYSYLIAPAEKYLISKNLIISPDDILSYLPFETLLNSEVDNEDLLYRKLPYLMNDYSISYAYSATLLAENDNIRPSLKNMAIVFSPSYSNPINLDSISIERQSAGRILRALPNARDEAEYVSGLTHGTLYSDTSATESNYKKNAGSYDIVHLAMHTYINIQNPNLSRLFFSEVNRKNVPMGMSAFEVYGIPLKAKMVVLSSCNTGVGTMRRGEGILSIARGFIYSGGRSVVMSLWEIDDKSGTDIVKSFYRYIKSGYSKSDALRKARIKYLRNAGTIRSFPYFWSTLVIYGDNSPVYFTLIARIIALLLASILVIGSVIYFKKRW